MINDLRLYDKDRETLKTEITDIITEVSEEDRNSEREHYFDWYTASKMSIKDH